MTVWDDTVKCAVEFSCEGQAIVNTLWFHKLGGFTATDAEGLGTELETWAVGEILPQMASTIIFERVTIYDMRSLDSWVVVSDTQQGEPGTDVGSVLPLNAAMTVTLETDRRGRSYRGRNYVSGFVEAAASGTLWEAGYLTAIDLAYTELLSSTFTALGWHLSVASGTQGGVVLVAGVTTHVTNCRPRARIHTMSSRTR